MALPHPTAAIVGTGFIGPVHLEALRRLGIPVRGLLGSIPSKSSAAARAQGLERGYQSYEELLADPEVTVIHLTSPNRLHYRQVLEALAAGKHVVCEKPLGMTSRETAELVAAAERRPDLICAVNYNIRFYPVALHMRGLIQSGEVGDVFHVTGAYEQDWLLWPTDFNWRVLAEEGGDLRAVGDIGTHWLDLAQFVSGLEVEEVCADLRTVHPVRQRPAGGSIETFSGKKEGGEPARVPVEITTDDYASVLLRFKGGARGCFTVSQVTPGRKNGIRLEVAGSKRALAWAGERPEELWIGQREGPNQLLLRDPSQLAPEAARYSNYPGGHAEGFPDTFKQLYRAIYADIRQGQRSDKPLYATFADGHRELLLCEAILQSHRSRSWVRVGQ